MKINEQGLIKRDDQNLKEMGELDLPNLKLYYIANQMRHTVDIMSQFNMELDQLDMELQDMSEKIYLDNIP